MTAAPAFTLEVPASPDYLVMARLFVAAAAEELGAGPAAADDLRLAVSEAAGSLIPGGGTVTVSVGDAAPGVAVRVAGTGDPQEPAAPGELALGLELVRGLLGEVTVTADGDRTEIRFSTSG